MSRRIWGLHCVIAMLIGGGSAGSFQEDAVPVEPSDLAKRTDLVGKKVRA